MSRINRMRAVRLVAAVVLVLNLAMAVIDAAAGHGFWVVSALCALILAGLLCFQTFVIRKLEKQEGSRGSLPVALLRTLTGRKRPDYARIRELEIECGMAEPEPRAVKAGRLDMPPTMAALKLIRVEPKVTGRKPKRFDFSEDRAAMRALAETYRPENLPRTRRDDD